MAKAKTVRIAPTSGKYLELFSKDHNVGIWKVSPVDGKQGTEFAYDEAVEILLNHPTLVMACMRKVNGKMVSDLDEEDLAKFNTAISTSGFLPSNLDNTPAVDDKSTKEALTAQAKTIASLTEQNTLLQKQNTELASKLDSLSEKFAAFESSLSPSPDTEKKADSEPVVTL